MGSQFSYGSQTRGQIGLPATERRLVTDRVLREIESNTKVRLLPTGVDVSAGQGRMYNLGKITRDGVGTYDMIVQDVDATSSQPEGEPSWLQFRVYESASEVGVFIAVGVEDAAGDDLQDNNNVAVAAVTDPDISGAGSDSRVTVFVARADDVTDAAALTPPVQPALVVGDLVILDASEAVNHEIRINRAS